MAVRQLADGRWVCYYRVAGAQGKSHIKAEYFGRGVEAARKARARHDELGLKKRRPARTLTGPTFGELAAAYCRAKPFSHNSLSHLFTRLTANILPDLGNRSAIHLTERDLHQYMARRLRSVQMATVSRELADIKAILNWAVKSKPPVIPFNPVATFHVAQNPQVAILPPTQEELSRILEAAAPHLLRAILLSYYVGLRPGATELLSLQWEAVDLKGEHLLVTSAKKGGREKRLVPIHQDLLHVMTVWHAKDGGLGPHHPLLWPEGSVTQEGVAWSTKKGGHYAQASHVRFEASFCNPDTGDGG